MDSVGLREQVFKDIAQRSFAIRAALWAYSLVEKTIFASLLLGGYGCASFFNTLVRRSNGGLLVTAERDNEEKQIQYVLACSNDQVAPLAVSESYLRKLQLLYVACANFRATAKFFRIVGKIEKRRSFLATCRAASTMTYYLRAELHIAEELPKAVVVGSNYNPDAVGLAFAGRSHNVPVVYISHAVVTQRIGTPPLQADLAILYGPAAVEAFRFHGPVRCRSFAYKGIEGESTLMKVPCPLLKDTTVGIFLTGLTDVDVLDHLIDCLSRSSLVSRIILRPHPAEVASPNMHNYPSTYAKVELSIGGVSRSASQRCDFVIAGDSSVHLEVLKTGVPSLYLDNLDDIPRDSYGLLKFRIMYEIENFDSIDWESVKSFFDSSWEERYRRFDSSYFRKEEDVRSEVRDAVYRLVSGDSNHSLNRVHE